MLRVGCLDGTSNALSSSQGLWQSGGKTSAWFRISNFMLENVMGSPEQTLNVLKPCKKAMDLVIKPQRGMQIFCAGSNQSAAWPNLEGQVAELKPLLPEISGETSLRESIALNQGGSGDTYCTPPSSESCNQVSRGLHIPVQLPSEPQCSEGSAYTSHVSQSQLGFVHEEDVEAECPGHVSGLIKPPLFNQGVNAGIKNSFKPLLETINQATGLAFSAHTTESQDCNVAADCRSFDGVTEAHTNAGISNDVHHARQSCGDIQHAGKEHYDFVDDFTSCNNQEVKSTQCCVYLQRPRSMHGMTVTSSPADRQGASAEYCSEDGDVFNSMAGDDLEESTNATNSLSSTATLRLPAYRTPTHLQHSLSDSVVYLESLGVDCNRIFQIEPRLSCFTVKQIRAIVSALEQYGLKWTDLGRLFNISPKILLLEPEEDLKAVTNFLLNEAGISLNDFRKVVRRCPRLLVADVKTQLRPTLSFLRSLGYPNVGNTIANNPSLLSFDVRSRLIPRLRLLESWGFTYREASAIAARFPAIFNYSATENLQRKYEYLIEEIRGGKDDLLAFPQYFGYSLEWRIRPRHQTLMKLNVSLSIQAMLMLSEAEFNASFPCVDEGDNVNRRGSLYKSIKKKLHERHMVKSLKGTNLESVDAGVLGSA